MFCTNCGRKLFDDFEYCPECGEKINGGQSGLCESQVTFDDYIGKTKRCKKCGEMMPDDSFYCLNCGNVFSEQNAEFETIHDKIKMMTGTWRNKWIALTLCILFGWLGIHRFYEGKVFTGLLYLCTFGFLGIGWFIDIIRIMIKPNPYRVK